MQGYLCYEFAGAVIYIQVVRLIRIALILLIFVGILRFCVDWQGHEQWQATELHKRQVDLQRLCGSLLTCKDCTHNKTGRYHDGLSSGEYWELKGCGETVKLKAACGGFAKHQCTWSHEGIQLFTHSD